MTSKASSRSDVEAGSIPPSDHPPPEEARRKSEAWLHQATQSGRIGVWEWDIADNRVSWTESLFVIHGLEPDAFDGTVEAWASLVHPDDRERVHTAIRRTLEDDAPYELEFRSVRPDGEVIWIYTTASVQRDSAGQPLRLIGSTLDITRRKRAEEALRISEQRFARFMQHLPGLAWIKDTAGRYVFANEAAIKAFGTTQAELVGKTDFDLFPPETAAQFQQNDRRALESEAGIQAVETLLHDDGVVHHSLISKFPIPGADDKPVLIGGMAIDVTEQREADRRKDEFLATLAHELRNPLAPLRSGLDLMQAQRNDPQSLENTLSLMERQLRQIVRLVDDLLDVSRISRGRIELRRARVELSDVVHAAVETSQPAIDEAGHALTVSLPPEPIFLDADVTRLSQVLANLLNNAAKYTPRSGHIALSVQPQVDQRVLISVKDDGQGIPPAMLGNIFELFTQVDHSLERSHGGLGIGLTIVKRLVEMHGGTIQAHSAGEGLGSEFIVTLPMAARPPVPASTAAGSADEPPSAAGHTILVADDNQDAATSLGMMLKIMGHVAHTAGDGLEALARAEQLRPDVIILDIGMPKLNGYETCRRIREQAWGKDVVLVALTGWGQDEDRRRSHEAGFDHHLVKPIAAADMAKILAAQSAK